MTTHGDYWLSSNLVTYVAFVCAGVDLVIVSRGRGRSTAVVTGLSGHCSYHKQIITVYFRCVRNTASTQAQSTDVAETKWTYTACE